MKTTDRRPFTLLEVMITCAFLALICAVCLYQGKDLLSSYGAKRDVKTLKEQLEFTRHLSLAYKTNMTLELINSDKGLLLMRHTDENLSYKERHFAPHKVKLPYIVKGIFPEKNYKISFDFLGVATPNQEIEIETKEGKKIKIKT